MLTFLLTVAFVAVTVAMVSAATAMVVAVAARAVAAHREARRDDAADRLAYAGTI